MKKIIFITLIFLLLLAGCKLFSSDSHSNFSKINITIPRSRALIDDAALIELTITGSDFDDIIITSETDNISVNVLQGKDRTFLLNMYNLDKSLLLYSGETITDVTSADNISISIEVSRSARQIIYHGNSETSGVVPSSEYYNDNTSATVLGNTGELVLDDYTFTGWNTLEDGSGTTYLIDSLIEIAGEDINLYAIWTELDTFSITYDLNGGASEVDIIDTNAYIEGADVTLNDGLGLTLTNFTFDGWATEADGDVVTPPFVMLGNNVTFYAIWTALPTYSVTYDYNGGVESGLPTDVNNYYTDDEITLASGSALSHTTLNFAGWSDTSGGSVITGTYTCPSNNVTFYAVWTTFTAATFTNAAAIGRYGPTQAQVDVEYSGTELDGYITVLTGKDGYQLWTVPVTATYLIEAHGAAGGESENTGGDRTGAVISGEFLLTAGDKLVIIVGQEGETQVGDYDAGAGGGSFVVSDPNGTPLDGDDIPLIIAGGGTGEPSDTTSNPGSATEVPTGTLGAVNGLGEGGGDTNGAGGGGFNSDGQHITNPDFNGLSYFNGLIGGNCSAGHGVGGFGGGSGGLDEYGSGGGGYTGGTGRDDSPDGGGGGSYNSGTNQTNTEGTNTGHGKIIISIVVSD